jgi:hypothetical protein
MWYSDHTAGWTIQGSVPGSSKRFFSAMKSLEWLWGPPSLLRNWYCSLYFQAWSGRSMRLATDLHLVPELRMSGATHPHPHITLWHLQGQFTFLTVTRGQDLPASWCENVTKWINMNSSEMSSEKCGSGLSPLHCSAQHTSWVPAPS